MKSNYSEFVNNWQGGAEVWAGMFLLVGCLIFIFYVIGLLVAKDRTMLYDYVSSHEIPAFLNFLIFLSLSLALYVNSMLVGEFKTVNNFEFVVQAILSLVIGGLFWYITRVILRIYYPYILAKHLNNIRFKPLHSPTTGRAMKLLNEDEEDVHLTEDQIAHEEIFAYDYDVWIDEETGEKLIEKYDVHHTSLLCDDCRFKTMREQNEEVVLEPTDNEEGKLVKHYKCDNCNAEKDIEKHIAPLELN
jgi:hypothetical protein